MTDDENKKDYEIGRGKPPKHTQFRKGKSGNPKGKPKLKQDFNTDFQDELEEVIKIQEGGKLKPITKQRALIKRLITNALNGSASSIKIVTSILSKMPVKVEDLEQDLSVEDAQILQQFIERRTNNE